MKSEEFLETFGTSNQGRAATAIDKRRKKREVWTWRLLLCSAFFTLHSSLFTSCSEENTTEEEFANWQERNEGTTDRWATRANSDWYRKILTYTQESSAQDLTNSDYIYVEQLEAGSGTESPIYTDTVRVSYRGRLIQSASYSEGYVFDQTYLNDFDWKTAGVADLAVSGVVDGFCTALLNMHKGDRWRVHIPYPLGYGSSSQSTIPAYSNLIFDIALQDFWHPGETHGEFKCR